tara:strand:+ start:3277 stop:3570 length:294 start_codon:yes stop_codon:yes gene_type:complete
MLTDIRDIIIIFGISLNLLLLLISTTLIINIFVKFRRLVRFIENSIEEISDIRSRVKNTIPKPISSVIDGVITIKSIVDRLFSRKRKNNNEKENDNG